MQKVDGIDEAAFCEVLGLKEETVEPSQTSLLRCLAGIHMEDLNAHDADELVKLVQLHLKDLPADINELENLAQNHPEASWARLFYLAHYQEQGGTLEDCLRSVRSKGRSRSFHYSLLWEHCQTVAAELYVWRVHSHRLCDAYVARRSRRTWGDREVLAWHGAPADINPYSLLEGELKPMETALARDMTWHLSPRPLQTHGKGPEWTVFYLCLALVQEKELGHFAKVTGSRVLPLYCIVHPSLWLSWPESAWPCSVQEARRAGVYR